MRHSILILIGPLAIAAVAALAPACSSHDDAAAPPSEALDAGSDGGGPAAVGLSVFGATCTPGTPKVDWSPMRRISRVEYDNMVRDLLGDATKPATSFVPESPLSNGISFEANTYAGVSTLIAQQYQQTAEALAAAAVADTNTLRNVVLPCQTEDDACAKQFIQTFANRAFRGQLDDAESTSLFTLYSTVAAMFDFTTGIQALITAVLESPRFLYVLELGTGVADGTVTPLTPSEIAGRLSLFLWRSVPDAALMAAAAAGQLATSDAVAAQATRMLADPKAKDAIDDFSTQWLQLQSTPTLGKDTQFTAWNSDAKLGAEMRDETLTNVAQLVLTANGTLPTLLTSPTSYIDQDLATFYATPLGTGAAAMVDDPSLGGTTQFVPTTLPHRAGILTNGSVLATQAHTTLPSSVLRGKLVRENVLCDVLHPPPPDIPPAPTSVPEGGTTRSQFEAHETIPGCVTCHTYMDPIGFGFGHFDATGAYQATDANGLQGTFPAIDATGEVNAMNPGELTTTFDGAVDLVTQLSTAPQVQECFTLQEMRYALSRVETLDDACSAQQILAAFTTGNENIQSLLVAITRSDAFRYRSIEVAGSSCQ